MMESLYEFFARHPSLTMYTFVAFFVLDAIWKTKVEQKLKKMGKKPEAVK